MDLSIVIINWNTRDLLAQCLSSIYANPPLSKFEIWVVDNASTDNSVAVIQNRFPGICLIKNKHNVGFAQANNQAIKKSQGRFVLLLNPDTEVEPDSLETLLRFMKEHPQAGVIGPLTLNPDRTLQTSCYPIPTLFRELWRLLHLDRVKPYGSFKMGKWRLDEPREVEAILGACLLLRKDALNQVGLLDENYFMYTEEIDLCYRLYRAEWKLFWVPKAIIIHYGGQSTKQVATEMFIQLYKSKVHFFRKHYGSVAAFVYKLILFVTALPRILVTLLAFFEKSPQRQQHIKLATKYFNLILALPTM